MQYFSQLAILAAFLIPLKLSATYIVLVPALLLWIWECKKSRHGLLADLPNRILVPYLCWLGIVVLGIVFGINYARTLDSLGTLLILALLPPFYLAVAKAIGSRRVLAALLLGQSIAALHTVCERHLPLILQGTFVGQLSESGQLALTAVVSFGFLFLIKEREIIYKRDLILGVLTIFLLTLFGLDHPLISNSLSVLALAILVVFSLARAWKFFRASQFSPTITLILIPLLTSALIVNLKRGPWFGVFFASLLFLVTLGRKRFTIFLGATAIVVMLVAPVRERLFSSYEHFVVAGGRMTMWQVGVELAAKFPLGIGYENSRFMRELDPEIPPSHRHFHSNPINILVETGWLGLGVFIWWLAEILRIAFARYSTRDDTIVANIVGAAVVSWQIAGLVEYNFGDSEVLLVTYLLLGVLLATVQAVSVQARDLSSTGPNSTNEANDTENTNPLMQAAR